MGRRKPKVLFIMLNPSTADADVDDPTIRRVVNFAKSWVMVVFLWVIYMLFVAQTQRDYDIQIIQ